MKRDLSNTQIQKRMRAAINTPEFKLELLKLEVMESVASAMQLQNVSKSELANRLGTSRAYITKMLQGDVNFTLETLQRLADALDCTLVSPLLRLKAVPKRERKSVANREKKLPVPVGK